MDADSQRFAEEQVPLVRAAAERLIDDLLRYQSKGMKRSELINAAQNAMVAEIGRFNAALFSK